MASEGQAHHARAFSWRLFVALALACWNVTSAVSSEEGVWAQEAFSPRVSALIEDLNGRDARARRAAALALKDALCSSEDTSRQAAADVLEDMGTDAAVVLPILTNVLRDLTPGVSPDDSTMDVHRLNIAFEREQQDVACALAKIAGAVQDAAATDSMADPRGTLAVLPKLRDAHDALVASKNLQIRQHADVVRRAVAYYEQLWLVKLTRAPPA